MVCRWTPRDTCYHLASHGIFIAGVNERPDGDRSRCATATVTALKPIPRSQFSNEPDIAILVREPSILRHFSPVVSRRPGVVSYLDTSIGLIKKKDLVCTREKLNKKKQKKQGNHFTRLFENSNVFRKLRRVSNLWKIRKTQDWNYWTYKWNVSMECSLSLFFFSVHPMHCLKSTEHFYLFTVSNISIGEGREAIKHHIRHPAFYDGITHALVLVANNDGPRINMAKWWIMYILMIEIYWTM